MTQESFHPAELWIKFGQHMTKNKSGRWSIFFSTFLIQLQIIWIFQVFFNIFRFITKHITCLTVCNQDNLCKVDQCSIDNFIQIVNPKVEASITQFFYNVISVDACEVVIISLETSGGLGDPNIMEKIQPSVCNTRQLEFQWNKFLRAGVFLIDTGCQLRQKLNYFSCLFFRYRFVDFGAKIWSREGASL